ncbi:hypothetical protein CYY_006926 [Polysphondylium violaceum]|uniref:GP-PDE domain-containing protein n=1 Tax=Polysphondylium violaceum TaxID=133409 RepID=A0A8J4UXZ0_9MYCE|nr:hypothetical protein CYY_006926 [Polysphondylium violaceum]
MGLKSLFYLLIVLTCIFLYYQNNVNPLFQHPRSKPIIFEKFHRSVDTNNIGNNSKKTTVATVGYDNDFYRPLILAHRGSRYLLPENTVLAFKTAVDLGADVIETDVRLTKDGVLVIHHDKLVDRTTNGVGDVENHTLEELVALDAGYRFSPDNGTTFPYRGKGVKIPTTRQMFEQLDPSVQLNIEIKENDVAVADALWTEIERAFESSARKPRSIVVSCRYCVPTLHIRKLAAEYAAKKGLDSRPITTSACETDATRFVVLSQLYLAKLYYTLYPTFHFESFQIPTNSGPIRLDTELFIDAANYFGKHIHYWVINHKDEINRVLDISNIDGIISDRADRVAQIYKDRGIFSKSLVIPKPLPTNTTGTYFIPSIDIEEVHTCISLTCLALQRIHHIILSIILTYIAYRVFKK